LNAASWSHISIEGCALAGPAPEKRVEGKPRIFARFGHAAYVTHQERIVEAETSLAQPRAALIRALLDQSGQDLIEYALMVSLLGLAAITGMRSVASSVSAAYSNVGTAFVAYLGSGNSASPGGNGNGAGAGQGNNGTNNGQGNNGDHGSGTGNGNNGNGKG
jgi:Flp pilus assembly pilin Flp